ncbi:retrovirus-related pol polyprotein from transposon TNT 1-94 [Tanacetum coccineum]|uniref:Retrovirus-related pol polyprotein from transposon TNT 1-94 n=1 Tax=Tanacetum coccineum TaxID=301880 RepID=A0ABQ5IM43_9ASTR
MKKDDDGDDSTEVNTTTDRVFVCSLCIVRMGNMKLSRIACGLLDEDGYPKVMVMACGNIVNAIDNDDMTELWHKRLGHISEKGMSILSKKNVLFGVHDINLKKCSHCLAGKQTSVLLLSVLL